MTSHEIAAADSLLTENAELRRALSVAMEENEGWRRLAAILQQRNKNADALESQLEEAHAEIARLTEALEHAARMFTIKGARKIVADALGKEGGPSERSPHRRRSRM